jgi:hypothetical protein
VGVYENRELLRRLLELWKVDTHGEAGVRVQDDVLGRDAAGFARPAGRTGDRWWRSILPFLKMRKYMRASIATSSVSGSTAMVQGVGLYFGGKTPRDKTDLRCQVSAQISAGGKPNHGLRRSAN